MVMAEHHPDYDFIMNPAQAPKKSIIPAGNSMKQRLIIVAAGAVLLLIAAIVVIALISSAGKAGQADLVKAAQQQAEIIRVSKLGLDRARGSSAKNLATTTNLSMQSDQTALLAALKTQGVKVSNEELAAGKDTKTDTALITAEQSNRFDEAFTEAIQAQLVAYQKTLKTAYDSASSTKLKDALALQFEHAGLLATAKQ